MSMSKQKEEKFLTEQEVRYVLCSDDVRYLQGRLLTLVDASTADPEQRKATKDLSVQILWDFIHTCRRVSKDELPK